MSPESCIIGVPLYMFYLRNCCSEECLSEECRFISVPKCHNSSYGVAEAVRHHCVRVCRFHQKGVWVTVGDNMAYRCLSVVLMDLPWHTVDKKEKLWYSEKCIMTIPYTGAKAVCKLWRCWAWTLLAKWCHYSSFIVFRLQFTSLSVVKKKFRVGSSCPLTHWIKSCVLIVKLLSVDVTELMGISHILFHSFYVDPFYTSVFKCGSYQSHVCN